MRPNTGYAILDSVGPFRGLATSLAANRLDPSFSPDLLNAVVRDGELRSRSGYRKIGQTLMGEVLAFTQFGPLGSPTTLVVFTSRRQYRYDPLTDLFLDITRRDDSFTDGIDTADSGTKIFTINGVDLTTHFTVGDQFTVTGSTANDGEYTVVSSAFPGANTEITVSESLVDDTGDGTIHFSHNHAITAVSTGSSTITVAGDHTPEFATDATFKIVGSTGNDGSYTVASSAFGADTVITVNETITDSTFDGEAIMVDELNTAVTGFIDFAEVTDVNGRRVIMTNGINSPLVWSGVVAKDFRQWRPNFNNFTTMRTIAVFTEHLFLGAITLSTVGEEPQTIAWSNAGDFDDHVGGTSGVQILYELETPIKAMRTLGDRLVIYSDNQIVNGAFIGLPVVFAFETVIPEGTRLISPKSVVPINVGHIYGSEENFYLFDGTRGMRIIGDVIRNDYKTVKDQDNLHKTASLNDFAKRTIYLAIPDIAGGSMVYTIEYNIFDLSKMVWGKEKYNDDVRAFGFLTNTILLTWLDAPDEDPLPGIGIPWQDEIGEWTNEGEQIDFPVRVFGNTAGEVFKISEGAAKDDGVEFIMHYDTMDFTTPGAFQSVLGRWGEIEFEVKGETVDVLVSKDSGSNFEDVEIGKVIDANFTTFRVPIDFSARMLRVRFRTTRPFRLRWVRLWVRDGGAR